MFTLTKDIPKYVYADQILKAIWFVKMNMTVFWKSRKCYAIRLTSICVLSDSLDGAGYLIISYVCLTSPVICFELAAELFFGHFGDLCIFRKMSAVSFSCVSAMSASWDVLVKPGGYCQSDSVKLQIPNAQI
jgi:hypothetical protein